MSTTPEQIAAHRDEAIAGREEVGRRDSKRLESFLHALVVVGEVVDQGLALRLRHADEKSDLAIDIERFAPGFRMHSHRRMRGGRPSSPFSLRWQSVSRACHPFFTGWSSGLRSRSARPTPVPCRHPGPLACFKGSP